MYHPTLKEVSVSRETWKLTQGKRNASHRIESSQPVCLYRSTDTKIHTVQQTIYMTSEPKRSANFTDTWLRQMMFCASSEGWFLITLLLRTLRREVCSQLVCYIPPKFRAETRFRLNIDQLYSTYSSTHQGLCMGARCNATPLLL